MVAQLCFFASITFSFIAWGIVTALLLITHGGAFRILLQQ